MAGTLGVLGDLVEDVVCWLDEPLRPGTDTRTRVFRRQGGSAANVAVMAAGQVPVRFIGCVGQDAAGTFAARRLAARGVDVRLQQGSRTGTIVILVQPGGERDMLPDRGACAELTPVDPTWLDGLAGLHLTAYSLFGGTTPDAAKTAAAQVHADNGWVSLDVSSTGLIDAVGLAAFREVVEVLRPELIFANADEAAVLRLDAEARPGCVVVIKRGADATTVLSPAARVDVPVPPVDVVDSTGAGDAFAAGFLAAVVASETTLVDAPAQLLQDWAVAGHTAAAQVLASPGAGPDDHS